MASLKDLIVEGSSRFLSNVFGDIIHANKFVTDNGNSSQFVKGDGTLDNNTYLTSSTTPQYTISKLTTAETGYIASYELKKDGTKVGDTINIPKDYLVKSGTVETVTTSNVPYQGAVVGDKYLDFVVNTYDTASGSGTTSHIYIPVNDLVDVYTEGNGININSSNIVSIKIDPTASNSNGLATTSSGLKLNTATQSSAGALSASDKTKLDGIASGAEVNVQSDWNQTNTTADDYIKNKPTSLSNFTNDPGYTTNTGTITEITMNNTSMGTSGNVNLGSVAVPAPNGDGPNGLTPLESKVYENYTCSAANTDYGYIYFMHVVPTSDNYYEPWHIRYTLEITTDRPECQGYFDITIGSAGTTSQYCIFNKFYSTSYYPSYSHLMAWYNSAAKYANKETYPIRIGERIYSAYQSNTRARTYTIKVYELHGCEVSFPENIEPYISFYTDTNYGYNTAWYATSNGVIDNYDANTVPYQYYEYYTNYKIHDTTTPLYRYRLFGFDKYNKIVPLTKLNRTSVTQNTLIPSSVPIIVSKSINYYYSSTNITNNSGRTATATVWRGYAVTNSPFYYNFNGIIPQNCTIYLKGSYNFVTDEFKLDDTTTNSWYIYITDSTPNSDFFKYFETGSFYWLVGVIGSSTTMYGALYLDNPLYYFDGISLISAKYMHEQITSLSCNNQIFSKRYVYGKYASNATIKKLRGLSIAWNQLALSYKVVNGTESTSGGITTITPTNNTCNYILKTRATADTSTSITYHIYLQSVIVKSNQPVAFNNVNGGLIGNNPTFDFTTGDDFRLCYDCFMSTTTTASTIQIYSPSASPFYIKEGSFMLFDLTRMFGTGLEPEPEEFFKLFPRESYEYCDGVLLDSYNGVETIKTYESDGTTLVDSKSVGETLALRSSGFDHDEAYRTTKITRIGRVNLGDLSWVLYDNSKKIFRYRAFHTAYGADHTKGSTVYPGMLCSRYSYRFTSDSLDSLINREFFLGSSSGDLYIRDTDYSDAASFKIAVDGIYMYFPLATPIEETISDIGSVSYECSYYNGYEIAEKAYEGVTNHATPTCTPFRADINYYHSPGDFR